MGEGEVKREGVRRVGEGRSGDMGERERGGWWGEEAEVSNME